MLGIERNYCFDKGGKYGVAAGELKNGIKKGGFQAQVGTTVGTTSGCIISAGPYVWQDWIDVAQGLSPPVALPAHHKLAVGAPGGGKGAAHKIQYDTAKMYIVSIQSNGKWG
ncbi:hypothetical protein PC9H_004395 [Pleurotus ostreatus]|uniref:Uncharacterized protein n=1 Tax=Pleurotus ostreatus TaxID=5322 RepID=A0A8H7A0X2_PLEOS|nr:uncharacterized protein PC9H_004395 [Pleurotus ostreatus]KAF7437553.1 hypothetical protein PC9H_004395 [Pleurotus ostreatus]